MPHYYFDIHDGAAFTNDSTGLELEGIEAMRNGAAKTLAGMAKDIRPDTDRREIMIEVRDEASRGCSWQGSL